MKIVGLSGTNGSGKDTVAAVLGDRYGYFVASATEMLGAELDKRGLEQTRENKRTVSAEWRRESGLGVIVDKAVEAAQVAGYDKVVVGSLRNPGEADRVHELNGTMVWVDADPRVRYDRIQSAKRGRAGEDDKTFEEFQAEEQAEMQHSGDSATLSLSGVKAKSDVFLKNDSNDIDAFKADVAEKLSVG